MENQEKKPKSTKNTNAKDVEKKVSTSKASKANATTQDRAVKSNASKQSASKRGAKTEPKQTNEVVKGQEVAVDTADVERNSSSDDFSIQSQGERIKKNAGKNSKRKKAAIATAVVLLVTASVAIPTAVYLSRRKVSVDIANNIDIIQEYTVNVNRGSTIKDIVPQEIAGYTFVGFYKDAELTVPYKDTDKINKNMTIYAKYEANVYKVTFPTSPAFTIEGEDIVNNQVEIEYNTEYRFKLNLNTGYNESDITVKVNGETITPDQDGYYTLTIYGDTLVEVEGVEINTYEVTFYDSLDKNEMYQTLDIQYNQLCTYTGVTPTKHSTHTYTYTFIGWVDAEGNEVDLNTTHIVSDLELFANFREEYIEYTISKPEQVNVKFGDLYLSNTATLHYGDIVEITYDTTEGHDVTAFSVSGAEKVDGSENQYRITGNLVVTYSEEIQKFTVTWKNWDGSTLETDTLVPYGTTPEYNGETPTREETASHRYTFTGWDQELNPVTGEITYTAVFDSEIKASYDFTIEDGIITSYTGNDTYVVLPSTYSLADMVETRSATLTYEDFSSFDGRDFANAPMAYRLMYLGGFYCTINGGERTFYKNIFEFFEAMDTLDPDWQTNESLFPMQIDGATYEISLNGMDDGQEAMEYTFECIAIATTMAEGLGKPFNIIFDDGTALENQTSAEQAMTQVGIIMEQKMQELTAQNPDITQEELIDQIYRFKFTTTPYRTGTVVAGDDFEVTGIGPSAFAGNSTITNITIPDSIISIGNNAFEGTAISTITIPENVSSLGRRVFKDCTNLTEVIYSARDCTVPTGQDDSPFIDLSANSTLTISNTVRKIPEEFLSYVIYSNYYIYGSVYPGKVIISEDNQIDEIGAYAFSYCNLNTIHLSKSLVIFGSHAFEGCNLINLYYTGDINDWVSISFEGRYANPLCYGANLYINNKLVTEANVDTATSINAYAFYGYDKLTSITIGDQVTSIGEEAFYECSGLTSITIPSSVTSIGRYAFMGCDGLVYVVNKSSLEFNVGDYGTSGEILEIVSDESEAVFIDIDGNRYKDYNNERYFIRNIDGSTEVMIDSSCTQIYQYAFSDRDDITSVSIPDSVTSIGNGTFEDCTSLTSVTIPDSVTSIGSYAFDGCSSLVYVVNKSSVEFNVGDYGTSTSNNPILEIVSNESEMNLIEINGNRYKDYNGERYFIKNLDGSTEIEIDSSCTQIYQYAFYNRNDITSVMIPDGVTSIGDRAFEDCTSLISVEFGENSQLTSIGTSAFEDCTSLTSITIPSSVTSIGYDAFRYCRSLTSITIPSSVTSIAIGAFSECSGLESITIPSSVTSIGDSAFDECLRLTNVYYSGDINDWVSISFGGGTANPLNNGANLYVNGNELVTEANIDTAITIGDYAFFGCTSITSVTIGNQVTSIGDRAFQLFGNLTNVTIESNYAYIYADVGGTGAYSDNYLLANATEVRVLISCIEEGSTNSYLEDTATFTKTTSEDGLYYIYTK